MLPLHTTRTDRAPREISMIGFFDVVVINSCWLRRQQQTDLRRRLRSPCSFLEKPCGTRRLTLFFLWAGVIDSRSRVVGNLGPADRGGSVSIGRDTRPDLFDNDLS